MGSVSVGEMPLLLLRLLLPLLLLLLGGLRWWVDVEVRAPVGHAAAALVSE